MIEQKRAKFAYEAVKKASGNGHAAEYGRLVRDLGAKVHYSGLGQTVAFLLSKDDGKGGTMAGRVVCELGDWLIDKRGIVATRESDRLKRLMEGLLAQNATVWHRAQEETLALSVWWKRFAEAFIDFEGATRD